MLVVVSSQISRGWVDPNAVVVGIGIVIVATGGFNRVFVDRDRSVPLIIPIDPLLLPHEWG